MPPRHWKTETILHFIAADLKKHPFRRTAYVTYAQKLAESKMLSCFDYCHSADLVSSSAMANRHEHVFTNGSKIIATGVEGRMEGDGYNDIIIDDPYSGQEAAESKVQRDAIYEWYKGVAKNRLEPGGNIIIIMHRWHIDDLVGRLIKENPDFKYIRLPALADSEDDPLGRQLGEPLIPSHWTKEALLKIKKDGEHTFSTEYQGIPIREEDRLIKGVYFYDSLPEGMGYNIAADLAYSTNEINDNSAMVIMGKVPNDKKRYIINVQTWKKPLDSKDGDNSIQRLIQCYDKYHTVIGIEDNGVQKGIFDTVKMKFSHIKPNKMIGDKRIRALAFMDAWNAGEILVPKQASWLNDYLEELYEFTGIGDRHDDMVDASAYAYNDSQTKGLQFKTLN